MGKNQSHLTRKKGGVNLSHLKNSIDGKMVGSVAVVVSINGSTCHSALKIDYDYDNIVPMVMVVIDDLDNDQTIMINDG